MSQRFLSHAMLGAIAAISFALSPGVASYAQETAPLIRAIAADFNSIDPADTRGAVDQDLVLNLYDHLVEPVFYEQEDGSLVGDPMEVVPNLAESWEVDGPVVTFKLRDDVTFYPTGNPMTADDVIYSFTRLLEIPANGKNQAGVAGLYTVDQMEKLDDHTVRITFMDGPGGKPAEIAVRLTSMKFLQFGIIDSVEVKKHATAEDPWAREWLQKNQASTGPYHIADHKPNQQIVLKAVPDRVWGPQPGFDHIVLRITGDADVVSLIRGGVVDYAAEGLTGRQYSAIESVGFPVIHGPTPNILRVSMAVDQPPFDDKAIRQALLYAIPVQQIIDIALGGYGVPSPCAYNADDPTCSNTFAAYTYDPEKARELLAAAGAENLEFDFWYSNALPYNDDIAILIKNAMSRIGVTVNLAPTPDVQLRTAVRARTFRESDSMSGMLLHQATFWLADPVTITNCCFVSFSDAGGSGNWSRQEIPELDQLHFKYRNSGDAEARTAAYRRIQDIMADEAGNNVPLVVLGRTIATSTRIEGVTFTQEPYARYTYIHRKDAE